MVPLNQSNVTQPADLEHAAVFFRAGGGEPLRRRPRISPAPYRGLMRGQRREGRIPSDEPERRAEPLLAATAPTQSSAYPRNLAVR